MADEDLGSDLSQHYYVLLKDSARERPFNGRLRCGGTGPSCVHLQDMSRPLAPCCTQGCLRQAWYGVPFYRPHNIKSLKRPWGACGPTLFCKWGNWGRQRIRIHDPWLLTSALHSKCPPATFGMCGNARGLAFSSETRGKNRRQNIIGRSLALLNYLSKSQSNKNASSQIKEAGNTPFHWRI